MQKKLKIEKLVLCIDLIKLNWLGMQKAAQITKIYKMIIKEYWEAGCCGAHL
jgi:hypothetical protein